MKNTKKIIKPLDSHEVSEHEAEWYEFLISQEERRKTGVPETTLKAEFKYKKTIRPLVISTSILMFALFSAWLLEDLDDGTSTLLVLSWLALTIFLIRKEIVSYNKAIGRYQEDTQSDGSNISKPSFSADDIDGLVMHLPNDATTDQSAVSIDLKVSQTTVISDIVIPHRSASILYFLMDERRNNGSHWLEEPKNHTELLLIINNSFALSQNFETEAMWKTRIGKKVETWIWDFKNKKKRGAISIINTEIRKTNRLKFNEFKLIVNIPSKSYSQNGTYALSGNIKSVDIIPPLK